MSVRSNPNNLDTSKSSTTNEFLIMTELSVRPAQISGDRSSSGAALLKMSSSADQSSK